MDVADAFFVKGGGQQFLGEAGAAGVGDIARVDDAFDASFLKPGYEAGKRGVFIADGEEAFGRHVGGGRCGYARRNGYREEIGLKK